MFWGQDIIAKELGAADWLAAASILTGAIGLGFLIRMIATKAVMRTEADPVIGRIVGRLISYVITLLGIFYALAALEVRVGPVLGALGIGGIVLGLALQDILTNMVSGVLLQARRPFRRGDQIVTNEFEGTVEDINLRVVTLKTFDGDNVYIPNSQVIQHPIVNWTRTPTRRTTVIVGVAYDTDLDHARRTVLAGVEAADGVETHPEPQAFVFEFGESSIDLAVHFWHRSEIQHMWTTRDAVARSVKAKLDSAGITIPFPQRTLWFGPGNTELSLRRPGSDSLTVGE